MLRRARFFNRIPMGEHLSVNLPLTSGLGGKVAGGVTFTRASTQWGPNDAGVLVQVGNNVPFCNSKGLLFEPASTNKCTAWGSIPADSLGAEKVVNGGFDTDTVWTKNAGWTISGGTAVATNSSAELYQNIALVKGRVYRFTFTIVTRTAGSVRIRPGFGSAYSQVFSAPGTYVVDITMPDDAINGYVYFSGSAFTGAIDDVSAKEILYAVGTKTAYLGGAWVQNHTNMTVSGDTAALLTTADDTAALTAAGLATLVKAYNGGSAVLKAYKLDNSAGVAAAYVDITGPTVNTNAHSLQTYMRTAGTGRICWTNTAAILATQVNSAGYAVLKAENAVPTASTSLKLRVDPGGVAYFILPQLEELAACSSPMPCQNGTASRAAVLLTFQVAVNLKANDFTMYFEATPNTITPAIQNLISSGALGGTGIRMYISGGLTAEKNLNGVAKTSYTNSLFAASATKKCALRISSTAGVASFAGGTKGGVNADTAGLAYSGATVALGCYGTTPTINPFYGYIKNVLVFRSPLTDARIAAITA